MEIYRSPVPRSFSKAAQNRAALPDPAGPAMQPGSLSARLQRSGICRSASASGISRSRAMRARSSYSHLRFSVP